MHVLRCICLPYLNLLTSLPVGFMFCLYCVNMQVPLGVLFKSEQKNEDVLDIMKSVHNYVPMVQRTTTATTSVNGTDDEVQLIDQQMHPIVFGGDQLTTERTRNIKNVVSNSDSASARLEGLVPVTEDWHAKMCLYQVSD